jgi:hypothetical protein
MKANFYCRKKQNLLKRGLLSLVFALVTFAATAQVGVGTTNPNPSAQIHIVAEDKGILIPQVPLTHSTDTTTITNGNVESLLVYNTNTQNDVFPGYYYWSNNRWNRIVSPSDGTGQMTLSGDILDYINLDGTLTSIDLGGIALSNQAITELVDNGDGTITYINELGLPTIINLATGSTGLSAYQIAVNNGFVGTEVEWLASLQGINGVDGANGIDGLSAYQIAVNNGFSGTEAQWLASLQGANGADGLSAYQIAVNNGFTGTETQWLASLQGINGVDGANGIDGLSAYQIAVNNGFTGTETQWLVSLQGTNGIDGLSAYQIAVNNGFSGTEAEWLASLQGANGADGVAGQDGVDGLSAYQIAVNNGFSGTEVEWLASLQGSDANIWLVDGTNTTVESVSSDVGTEWKVNVATANGTNLGVVKEAENNPTVSIDNQGSLSVNLENLNDIKEITGAYEAQLTDVILLGNASTADVTVILPSPENNKGKTFTIKKQDSNEDYYVNVYGNINGLSQLYTALPYSGWVLVSDGTQWRITNKF